MVTPQLIRFGPHRVWLVLALLLLTACTTPATKTTKAQPDFIRQALQAPTPAKEPQKTAVPEYAPMVEDLSPIKTRMVDISARNTPLSDVLHVIAEAAGLNLLIDMGVAVDYPVTLTLKRVTVENALASIFTTLDYFYTIKDNLLIVSGTATRAFELGHPALVQGYAIDIGGDILGGALSASGGSASSSIKGGVSTTIKSDTTAFDFWESMEKSLTTIIGKRAAAVTRTASSSSNQANSAKGTSTQFTSQVATTVEKSGEQAGGDSEGSGSEQRVTVNRLTGTIVVTASKRNLENVENYLNMVRRVLNRQVLVEARIIEVQLSDSLNFGVDWSFLDNFKELGGAFATGFGELNLASRSFDDLVESSVPKFRIGTSRANFQTLLTALQTQGDVSTLSNPRVNVMNGHTALLSVGRNISFISKVTSTTTVAAGSAPITTFNVETGSVLSGVLVGMVPFINEHGEISITITPIISDLVTMQEKAIGKAGEQTIISLPTIDLKEMSTTVKVRDNQLVVIGGLISKKELVEDEKVPLLGDIPGLGYLFTRKKTQNSKSELVVILQPKLVSNDLM